MARGQIKSKSRGRGYDGRYPFGLALALAGLIGWWWSRITVKRKTNCLSSQVVAHRDVEVSLAPPTKNPFDPPPQSNSLLPPNQRRKDAESILDPVKFIAWLGASAGGLTIFLVIIGFLALAAHDLMLGSPGMILAQPEYISVGALFFSRTIMFGVAALGSLGRNLAESGHGWVVAIASIVIVGLFLKIARSNPAFSTKRLGESALLIGPAVLLVFELYVMHRLTIPLQITNLLLQFSDLSSLAASEYSGATQPILKALIRNDSAVLQHEYGVLALFVFALAIIYGRLHQTYQKEVHAAARSTCIITWHWLRIPTLVLLLICFFLLVRSYGVLTISNEYPTFDRTPESNRADLQNGVPVFLLRESEKIFVLYDPCSQSIVSLKRDAVEQFRLNSPQNLFLYQLYTSPGACRKAPNRIFQQ